MAERKRLDTQNPGCLEGLFNFLALNQRLQMPKRIAYQKDSEGNSNTLRVKVSKPKNRLEKDEAVLKGTNNVSPKAKVGTFIWRTLMFKKRTPRKDQKQSDPQTSSPSSSRLTRTKSIHHSKCFDYTVPEELASHYQSMIESSSNEVGLCHSEPPLSQGSPQGPILQDSCKIPGVKHSFDAEAPCESETVPRIINDETEASSKQKSRDAVTHHSKEFLDFLELFNAHRELFLKILHDPSLLVPLEHQDQEASSSSVVPLNKRELFPRPGGSSGKRNPIFDRSDSEKNRRSEIQMSPSRSKSNIEAIKVIGTRMPDGVEGSSISLAESKNLRKSGTTLNRFKAIRKKIKAAVKENRKELARVTKDGVFHKLPYGQKMAEFTKSPSTQKFVHEEKQMRRSYSIAESVDKYSTLYASISKESKISPERLSTTFEDGAGFNRKPPMCVKRISSLPEMRLYSPHRDVLPEASNSQIVPKTYNMEPGCFSSHQTDSFSICTEGNFYPDDITEKTADIYSEQNYGEGALPGSLEEDIRTILRSPSLSSFVQSFSHRRINSLPSFDRSFFQDRTTSFTEHSIADSEPTFEHMQLEDDDWLVKPPHPPGPYAVNSKDDEWLVRPLQSSGVNTTDHEDEEWLVSTSQLSCGNAADFDDEEWLVKPVQPSSSDALNSELQFMHDFAEDAGSLHIYVNDKNEADFQYVKDILKKSGFSCGEADWYAANQPVSPVIFEEAECSCQETDMADDEPHSVVRRMLLFDLINEVLLDIYDSSLVTGPWHSCFDSRTRPIPIGFHVLEEVWANVSCYLSLQWKSGLSVENIVAHDVMMKNSWMNLVYDAECLALDLEDMVVDDLLDDIVLQIVLISIDA
ncbi:hypothetical protein ABZP36_011117 [Zizania latifolia]